MGDFDTLFGEDLSATLYKESGVVCLTFRILRVTLSVLII